MQIKSHEIKIVDTSTIIPHERNRNKHSDEQIERLAKIIEASGFRQPLVVSKLSGKLVSGHGRLMAAKKLGMAHVPVIYEDFASDDEEIQHLVADNAIAEWAELDLSGINADLADLGPIDIDLLGLKDFTVDFAEKEPASKKEKEPKACPHCGEVI